MSTKTTMQVPTARRDPDSGFVVHGQRFADPYMWMENLNDPAVTDWIAAQEAVTHAFLAEVPGKAWIQAEVTRAMRYARISPPIAAGPHGREFFWQADAQDDKAKFMLRRHMDTPVEVLIDPNAWAYNDMLVFAAPSPNGKLVAFGKSVGSSHDARIYVLDVETGVTLPDRPYGTQHASLAWRPDGTGFFYAACPDPGDVPADEAAHWNAIYEHRIDSSAPARKIFGDEHVKEYWCAVAISECGRFAILTKWDFVHANVVFLLRFADEALIPVAPAMQAINQVQVIGDRLLICTDDAAPRGRACVAALESPQDWTTIIPEGADTLQTIVGIGGRLYAVYSHAASHRIRIYTETGAFLRELALPGIGSVNYNEGEGVMSGVSGAWGSDDVWVRFESYVQPPSIYRYDYAADRLLPYHIPEIGLDASDYVTSRIVYESRDGTPVSMFLVHHKNTPRDGQQPVRLSGYGGFNISVEPRFTALQAAWLKSGGMLAFANIRGGGEYGREWHAAAITTRRQNAFDDYIAATRRLVAEGYTTPARLVSRGNSNGGLLVAVAAMQAPDAFGAVYCRAPILDMLRFPEFSHLSSAIVEYGAPDDPVEGAYLAAYSPYHNIRAEHPYPIMLFAAALNDRIAPPYDPMKMVARLQAEATQGGPFLLLPMHTSGHSGGITLGARIAQDVDELCFYYRALQIRPPEQ